jgi:chemotaxis protein MotB
MSRRKRAAPPENHERWLISYADFITLLFAFFVVLFASSQTKQEKLNQMRDAVQEAFENGRVQRAVAGFLGRAEIRRQVRLPDARPYAELPPHSPSAADAAVAELLPSVRVLTSELEKEIEAGKLQVSLEPRGLVVSMREAAFFPPAEDAINRDAKSMIAKVADVVRKLPNPVRLEGHTDSTPIRNARFRSNWELSAARSIAMMELLATEFNIPRERLAISGYADTVPLEPNSTVEGRSRNRRVDIVILNEFGLKTEPGQKPSPMQPTS